MLAGSDGVFWDTQECMSAFLTNRRCLHADLHVCLHAAGSTDLSVNMYKVAYALTWYIDAAKINGSLGMCIYIYVYKYI